VSSKQPHRGSVGFYKIKVIYIAQKNLSTLAIKLSGW